MSEENLQDVSSGWDCYRQPDDIDGINSVVEFLQIVDCMQHAYGLSCADIEEVIQIPEATIFRARRALREGASLKGWYRPRYFQALLPPLRSLLLDYKKGLRVPRSVQIDQEVFADFLAYVHEISGMTRKEIADFVGLSRGAIYFFHRADIRMSYQHLKAFEDVWARAEQMHLDRLASQKDLAARLQQYVDAIEQKSEFEFPEHWFDLPYRIVFQVCVDVFNLSYVQSLLGAVNDNVVAASRLGQVERQFIQDYRVKSSEKMEYISYSPDQIKPYKQAKSAFLKDFFSQYGARALRKSEGDEQLAGKAVDMSLPDFSDMINRRSSIPWNVFKNSSLQENKVNSDLE